MNKFNQRGITHIFLLVAALGLLLFLLISNTFSFRDKLFSNLFPKPPSQALSPYKIGAYYFGMWSSADPHRGAVAGGDRVYGRPDNWTGVKEFYGQEPGIPQDTRGWSGDFSHLKPLIGYYDYALDGKNILEQHIRQAKQNGLTFFNFYWYWNQLTNDEVLKDGLKYFLQASNKDDLSFLISITAAGGGEYFYTVSQTERDNTIIYSAYRDEGIAFYVPDQQGSNLVPVYRLIHNGVHFYTASNSEKDNAISNLGYTYEGIAFYAYDQPGTNLLPVYRLAGDGLSIPASQYPKAVQTIVDKYFTQPNYLKTSSGRPMVFLLHNAGIQNTVGFITLIRQVTQQRLGVNPYIIWNIELGDPSGLNVDADYNCHADLGTLSTPQDNQQKYIDNVVNYNNSNGGIRPSVPCFISNFDERPRQDVQVADRNSIRYWNDYSDDKFRDGLLRIKNYMDSRTDELSKYLNIYAWNEWHEGGIIEPNVRDKNKWLNIISNTFNLITNPIGTLDNANCSVIEGWACDADDYNAALDIHIYRDGPQGIGTFVGSIQANLSRPDLITANACGGTGNHGFSFTTPSSLKDGNSHNIYAYAIDLPSTASSILNSSPKTIVCTPPPKIGDINGDGSVNVVDFSIMLSKWGTSDPASDLNGDGIVNVVDFSILLSKWGT